MLKKCVEEKASFTNYVCGFFFDVVSADYYLLTVLYVVLHKISYKIII